MTTKAELSSVKLTKEDLPKVYQELEKVIGLEATIRFAGEFGGVRVYFPKLEETKAFARVRNKAILAEFDGRNYRLLARKYKLSETWIREIVDADRRARAEGKKHG